jgi:hypothetical protein
MSISDTAWQMEAENLARAKNMVQMILQDWDFMFCDHGSRQRI